MPDQAGKLSLERNGGYTRPKGPFHPVEGQGVNCPLSGPRAPGQPERRSCFYKGSSAAVLCVYTLQLNWFLSVCLYSVVHVHCIHNWFVSLALAKSNTLVFVLEKTECCLQLIFFWNILECSLLSVQFDLLSQIGLIRGSESKLYTCSCSFSFQSSAFSFQPPAFSLQLSSFRFQPSAFSLQLSASVLSTKPL
jgi:hypothetical protein